MEEESTVKENVELLSVDSEEVKHIEDTTAGSSWNRDFFGFQLAVKLERLDDSIVQEEEKEPDYNERKQSFLQVIRRQALKKHRLTGNEIRKFNRNDKRSRVNWIKRIPGSSRLHCPICPSSLSNRSSLLRHIKLFHPNPSEFYQCSKCESTFRSLIELVHHAQSAHAEKDKFICRECNLSFKDESNLNNHLDSLHKSALNLREYKCSKCSGVFRRKMELLEHLKIAHNESELVPCRTCNKSFKDEETLSRHILLAHKTVRKYRRGECSSTFLVKGALSRHTHVYHKKNVPCGLSNFKEASELKPHTPAVHTKLRQHKCSKCNLAFSDRRKLRRHISTDHEDGGPFKCVECDACFPSRYKLKLHQFRIHYKISPFKCQECDIDFKSKYRLVQHKQKAHDVKGHYLCIVCNETFSSERILDKHYRLCSKKNKKTEPSLLVKAEHDVLGKAEQDVLGKVEHDLLVKTEHSMPENSEPNVLYKDTLQNVKLNDSVKSEPDLKPFHCSECSSCFSKKQSLALHYTVRHGSMAKSFLKCPDCGNNFKKKIRLMKHIKTAHKKTFGCSICSLKFRWQKDLDEHLVSVHNKNLFKCSECDMSFDNKGSLTKHIASQHGKLQVMDLFKSDDSFSNKRSSDEQILAVHEIQIQSDLILLKPLKRSNCDDTFNYQNQLDDHLDLVNKIINQSEERLSFKCSNCDMAFSDENKLDKHISTLHCQQRSFGCVKCDQNFGNQNQLDEHNLSVHTQKCPSGNKSNQYTNNSHGSSLIQNEPKSFDCLEYDKSFSSQSQLNKPHNNVLEENSTNFVEKSKLLQCNYCNNTFDLESSLLKHLMSHQNIIGLNGSSKTTDKVVHSENKSEKHFSSVYEIPIHSVASTSRRFKCTLCQYSCDEEKIFSRHIQSHGNKVMSLKCWKCSRSFVNQNLLDAHMTSIHRIQYQLSNNPSKSFECPFCDFTFDDNSSMSEHILSHSRKLRSFPCLKCNMAFKAQDLLDTHTNAYHGARILSVNKFQEPFRCSYCNFSCNDLNSLSRHSLLHCSKKEQFDCNICDENFESQTELDYHKQTLHGIRKPGYAIKKTGIKPNNSGHEINRPGNDMTNAKLEAKKWGPEVKNSERDIKKSVNELKKFRLGIENSRNEMNNSGSEFTKSRPEVKNLGHEFQNFSDEIRIQSVTSLFRPFECSQCNFTFSDENGLLNHNRTVHRNFRLFECSICDYTFDSDGELDVHIRSVHKMTRPVVNLSNNLKCAYCAYACREVSILMNHTQLCHKNVERYPCLKCGGSFSSQSDLDRHSLSAHKDHSSKHNQLNQKNISGNPIENGNRNSSRRQHQVYKCKECGSCFRNASQLDDHKLNCNDDVIVLSDEDDIGQSRCEHCQSSFSNDEALVKHILSVHRKIGQYQCSECKNSFNSQRLLDDHTLSCHEILILPDNKSFDTKINCSDDIGFTKVRFPSNPLGNTGTKLKPYLCEECDQAFSELNELFMHENSAHRRPSQISHETVTTGDLNKSKNNDQPYQRFPILKEGKPYKCTMCNSVFSEDFRLSYHILAVHKSTKAT